jgi:hypothetical protein
MNSSPRRFDLPAVLLFAVPLVACQGSAAAPAPQERLTSTDEALCSGGALSVTPSSASGPPGTNVTWTASATCQMASPQYEFWYYQEPSGPWVNAAPYGTSSTYAWTVPSGAANGTVYDWQVWVREAGSTSAYETWAGSKFTVGTPATCTSVSTTASPPGGATGGTMVTLTSSTQGCGNPEYAIYYQPPGGAWTPLQAYSSPSTYTWNTTGAASGTYAFQVWARQIGDSAPYEAYDAFSYTVGGNCSAVTASTSPAMPATGDPLTITASTTCSGSPTYAYYLLPPGGTWQLAQDYSSSNTYTFNTTGQPTGTYDYQVWARASGSTAAYDSYAASSFAVNPACTSATFSLPSFGYVGSTVNLLGAASGCYAPNYEILMLPPGGAWTTLQSWFTASPDSYTWSTSGATPGSYQLQLWVRQYGSTSLYETYAATSFNLLASSGLSFGTSPVQYGPNGGTGVASGDLNGDGILDLVANGSPIATYLGNGDGTFHAGGTNPLGGDYPGGLGDFNGDGKLDFAIPNYSTNAVKVYLGNGNGTFQSPSSYAVGTKPSGVAIGDFNGDGRSDIAVANWGSNYLSVLLANPGGTFQPAVNYALCAPPENLALGDFNGDGHLDLVAPNEACNTVSLLLGLGNGSFQPATTYGTGSLPFGVAVGDFNGDGRADVAVSYYQSPDLGILLGRAGGTLAPILTSSAVFPLGFGPSSQAGVNLAVGDINGDGKLDIVGTALAPGYMVAISLGRGDGVFGATIDLVTPLGGSEPVFATVGDFNKNGKLDIATMNIGPGTVDVWLQ